MKKEISRRDFLKGAAAGAVSLAAAGVLGGCGSEAAETQAAATAAEQPQTAATTAAETTQAAAQAAAETAAEAVPETQEGAQ